MTLLQKIQTAKSKKDLELLQVEIIMDMENFAENQKAYLQKLSELNE